MNALVKSSFEEFDDMLDKYFPLTLLFEGVTKFLSNYPSDKFEFKHHGCYTAIHTISQEGLHEIKFTLELWRDIPVWELVIGFKNVLIQQEISKSNVFD